MTTKTPTIKGLIVGGLTAFALVSSAYAQDQISADELGLTKGSVFSTPTPQPFVYHEGAPGAPDNPQLGQSFPGAPPQIPHDISGFTPITAQNNACMGCHSAPDRWGQPKQKGLPTPIPKSHYADPAYGKPQAGLPPKHEKKLSESRYNCTQCHAPQAHVKPLVANTFSSTK